MDVYSGEAALKQVFQDVSIVVNCLPLTRQTHHFFNEARLSMLPVDAVLVNISRGDVVDEQALLKQLDTEQMKGAVLDAHSVEPLPSTSVLWEHPKVWITPHISGATKAESAAHVVVENIKRIRKGEVAFPLHVPPCQQGMSQVIHNQVAKV
ncbi:hypothetical protein ATN88_20640 [Enterovibrio coralii]|uniref:D-isomer specific 2-hydroxyacid dehydrogenase NAD-binding domain-containing protein n=1 Tax=Enterovibrio coralii TaxID=294935 RepID=A0A135I8W2_9GAMM|nr:hypothetical protein ATN88_20640 [Enterovibrio coralii]